MEELFFLLKTFNSQGKRNSVGYIVDAFYRERYPFHDQDILNHMYYDKVQFNKKCADKEEYILCAAREKLCILLDETNIKKSCSKIMCFNNSCNVEEFWENRYGR